MISTTQLISVWDAMRKLNRLPTAREFQAMIEESGVTVVQPIRHDDSPKVFSRK